MDAAAAPPQRNICDVLMANARANAKKKSCSASSSPPNKLKKAKKELIQVRSLNLKANVFPLKRQDDSDLSPEKKPKIQDQEDDPSKEEQPQPSPFKRMISSPPKKGKKEEDVFEEWIDQLKKKASDFMPQSPAYWKQVGVMMPVGALMARYLKVLKSGPSWFYLHILTQSSAYVVGIVGWVTCLILDSQSSGIRHDAHRIIGIILLSLGTLQSICFASKTQARQQIQILLELLPPNDRVCRDHPQHCGRFQRV